MIDRVPLPGLDRTASRLALGTMTFGDSVAAGEAEAMVRTALDAGVNWFDTANVYAGGESERLLGAALAPVRDEVIVATKAHHRWGPGPEGVGLAPAALVRAVEASLSRLRMERVDILYFHQPDWTVDLAESLAAGADLVTAGKVGTVALSNYPAWLIAQAHVVADERGWEPPRIHQLVYSAIARSADDEYAHFAACAGLHNTVYNPLAGGLLTERYADRHERPETGRFVNPHYQDQYWNPPMLAAAQRLRDLADEAGCSVIELAYGWLLSSSSLASSVLVGASSLDQLEENLRAAAQPPLDDAVVQRCDAVAAELRRPGPRYWR